MPGVVLISGAKGSSGAQVVTSSSEDANHNALDVKDATARTSLGLLSACHPQNGTLATATGTAGDAFDLVQGGSYYLLVRPDPADLTTPTAAYVSLTGTAADDDGDTFLLTSQMPPFPVTPDANCTVSILECTTAAVVQCLGLTAASTTA